MYFRRLHYLKLVIDHGSFAAAAKAAGVSQPAISQAMKQLQRQYASPLLVRSGRSCIPTELARQIASEATSLVQRMDSLLTEPPSTLDRHVLRVGATPSAALVCGPKLYESWCAGHPRRRLQMSSADEGRLLAGLLRNELDMVIAPKPRGPIPKGVQCSTLYQLRPQVYAGRNHPGVAAQTLEDLQDLDWACVGPSVDGPVDVLTEAYRTRRLKPPRVVVNCPDYTSMLNLVGQTHLLAVFPHPALVEGARKNVVALRLREALPLYDMCVFALSSARQRTRAVIHSLAGLGRSA